MKSWYLIRVFKSSWLLGVCILIFILGEIFFNVKRIQNFPFFIYDMYSRPQQAQSIYEVYSIYCNGKLFDYTKLGDYQEGILIQTLRQYEMAKHKTSLQPAVYTKCMAINNKKVQQRVLKQFFADSAALERYPLWLSAVLDRFSGDSIFSCRIERSAVEYRNTWVKSPVEKNVLNLHEERE